ncbi:MAG TPA: hypothetical protein VK679_10865 [Gemmatimonadaceae bacterium]|nr:hypothetical protein [Gemmatimonadaceae bacterium]
MTVRDAIVRILRYAIACSASALTACRDPRPAATLQLPLDFSRLDRVRSIPGPPWDSVDTPHLRLYTEPGAYAARHIAALERRAERALTDDLALLHASGYGPRIHIFYFESQARLDSVFGVPGDGQAYPEALLVMVTANAHGLETPSDRHEMMHVLSITMWGWGAPNERWRHEGLGNLASAPDWPYTIDQMAAQARRDGDTRGPAELSGAGFSAGDSVAKFRAYMLSSSFVGYLIRANGIDNFRQLWEQGLPAAPTIYGADIATLTARWNGYLRTVSLPANGIDLAHVQQGASR